MGPKSESEVAPGWYRHEIARGWPDGLDKGILPRPPKVANGCAATSKRGRVVFDHSEWQQRQLEHMGDALIYVAARIIAHQRHGKNAGAYFLFAQKLCSNENFRSHPGIKNAATFEVLVGDAFVRFGINCAVDLAISLLKETSAYHV